MRLINDLPGVEKKIESGEISLSVASQVQSHIQRENKKRREEKSFKLSQTEKLDLVKQLEGTSARKCEAKLAEISPETGLPREKSRALTPEKTLIQFVADRDLVKKLQKLLALTSHQNPKGKYEKLFNQLAELGLNKLDPARREERRQKRATQSSENRKSGEQLKAKRKFTKLYRAPGRARQEPKAGGSQQKSLLPTSAVDRYISPQLKDKIWLRDQGKCQFKNKKTGKICGSQRLVEFDHKFPFSLGGEHSEENLQLRCRAHNQFQAEKVGLRGR